MEIVLPPRLEQWVVAQVRVGRYVDADEVVRDALRRMREADTPEISPNLVREALQIANQAQRDVLSLVQRADRETDLFHQVLGATTNAVDASLDVARRVPVAREVEKVFRGSLEQVTRTAQRGERDARAMRQGLESAAKALGLLTSVLERVSATSNALNRPPNGE
ncbi:MAG: type II toxin-antitoxin system ParD family antitoxin [Actinomycetota bacterium]|nr:type II toxin-antitoxin system ParD family antitoxin [Actinomycetota bacterium]